MDFLHPNDLEGLHLSSSGVYKPIQYDVTENTDFPA